MGPKEEKESKQRKLPPEKYEKAGASKGKSSPGGSRAVIINHCAAAFCVLRNYKSVPPNFRHIILDIFRIKSILIINL